MKINANMEKMPSGTVIAQSFFQNAVLLSSKLENVANDAIRTGELNQAELNDALIGMRSSISEIQESVVAKSSFTPQYHANIYQYTCIQLDFPHINTQSQALNDIAGKLRSETVPDLKKIDRITDSLTNKTATIDNLHIKLVETFPVKLNVLSGNSSAEKYSEIAMDTVSKINKYLQTAFSVQENINYETVKNLI